MNNLALIPGSLKAISDASGKSLAESFISADIIVIVDTSGSMNALDSRGGKSRYDVACQELAGLQANMPGKIAVIAFSDKTQFCPSGIPFMFGGGTDLAGALRFSKVADVPGMRFFVISDGQPDDEQSAINVAKTYKNRIDVIYVGPETNSSGRNFLTKLAGISGGQAVTADRANELAANITKLLLSDRI